MQGRSEPSEPKQTFGTPGFLPRGGWKLGRVSTVWLVLGAAAHSSFAAGTSAVRAIAPRIAGAPAESARAAQRMPVTSEARKGGSTTAIGQGHIGGAPPSNVPRS